MALTDTISDYKKQSEKMKHVNKFHRDLQKNMNFTNELLMKINFLDISVENVNGNIKTNWYRKDSYSGRVLHYFSHHPTHQKRAIIYNLIDRAVLLSNKKQHQKNIETVKNILKNNKYLNNFIEKNIKIRLNNIKYNNNQKSTITNKKK